MVHRFFDLLEQKDIEAWGQLLQSGARIICSLRARSCPPVIEGGRRCLLACATG